MPSFIEQRISREVSYSFTAVPRYNTRRTKLENKKSYRMPLWDDAERTFNANYQKFTPAKYALLLNAFHALYGGAYGFRFWDPTDFEVVDGPQGDIPAGSDPIQLQKWYTFGSNTNIRKITKPNTDIPIVVKQDGVVVPGSLSGTLGLWVPDDPWGAGDITATFQFDVPVIFLNDELPSSYVEFEALDVAVELQEIDPLT